MDSCRVALHVGTTLGEGLHWDPKAEWLWMVDIHSQRILRWRPSEAHWCTWHTPQRVGWVIPLQDSRQLLLGLQQGVARAAMDGDALQVEWVCKLFEHAPQLRLNDAKADSSGAVWAGSLNNDAEERPDGGLHRIDAATGVATVVDSGLCVANGPAIHADGNWMLHTDSVQRTIYAFDLDVPAGRIDNRRVWKTLPADAGYPDGMCFDADGCVWLAHWGGGCISRFSPDGELLRRVVLPAKNITNVCFGGEKLDRLFVSSARAGLSAADLAQQPLAGALFEVDAQGVKGLPGLPARG